MKTTLDGWEALQAVVRFGSFAAAAKKLNRSQSTVSYALARLQEQLGVRLFELRGRKAVLTEAGRVLLSDAEPLLGSFGRLEQRARTLGSGGKLELRLSVDSIYPYPKLFAALRSFGRKYPHVHTILRQATFISPETEFLTQGADLCIAGLASRELLMQPVLEVCLRAVARKGHPLAAKKRILSRADLMRHLAVVIEGDSSGEVKSQPRAPAQRTLAVSTIEAAIEAVRCGLGFAWLPRYRIQPLLEAEELIPLRLPLGGQRWARFHLFCRDGDASGRELRELAGLLGLGRDMEVI